jgi:hypothetical protein
VIENVRLAVRPNLLRGMVPPGSDATRATAPCKAAHAESFLDRVGRKAASAQAQCDARRNDSGRHFLSLFPI